MNAIEVPQNEEKRLKALDEYKILDTLPEEDYDAIAKIASHICDTPIALVSLIDKDRQWFKANYGINERETPRQISFCSHSILEPNDLFIINDATKDDRFSNNPLTTGDPNVIFYAGAPLNTDDGFSLGTLCVIDNEPRDLNDSQKKALKLLANQVVNLLELRKKNSELSKTNKTISDLNQQLDKFAYQLTHNLKSPISGVNFLIDVIKQDFAKDFESTGALNYVDLIADRMAYMGNLVEEILTYTRVNSENIVFEEFNLHQLLESILKNIDFNNKIEILGKGTDVEILSSKISFVQIFQNLISNSRKFTNKDKVEITVQFSETDQFYEFLFMDNGPGIEKEYWDKVFVIFETLGYKSKDSTGIGLSTVKSIIERLGGTIHLQNRPDGKEGACFNFKVSKTK